MTIQTNGIHTEDPKPGRPSLDVTSQPRPITITLTAEDIALLDEVGQGNYSEGVRLAIRALRTQRAELQRILARLEADPTSVVSHDELQHRLAIKAEAHLFEQVRAKSDAHLLEEVRAKSDAHLLEEVRAKKAAPHVLAP
jgi:Arc/MetJ-type ribon-helix-helix transcriptional regulator